MKVANPPAAAVVVLGHDPEEQQTVRNDEGIVVAEIKLVLSFSSLLVE